MNPSSLIQVKDIWKSFENFTVLRGISVQIQAGEVVAVIGPSGSGKSTFIRTLNGLEPIQSGIIWINDKLIQGERHWKQIRPEIGMVFQSFNLFPHLNVLQNITLAPIQVRGLQESKANELATELLMRVGLEDQKDKLPSLLSGGQQQRVAIARALAMQPKIMLFDEPTSALDPEKVGEVLTVIRDLAHTGMTLIVVTHEMGFAKEVADRVLFFDEGQILEEASAQSFFDRPSHPRAQAFLREVIS